MYGIKQLFTYHIVATSASGVGIDVSDIYHVLLSKPFLIIETNIEHLVWPPTAAGLNKIY